MSKDALDIFIDSSAEAFRVTNQVGEVAALVERLRSFAPDYIIVEASGRFEAALVTAHASYPEAFAASVKEKALPSDRKPLRVKYLNNAIERDHRCIRRRWRAMQCFRSFHTAEQTIEGIEAEHMIMKGQVRRLDGRDAAGQAKFVESLFRVAA